MSMSPMWGMVVYFIARLPLIREIAMAIDSSFENNSVDKNFYAKIGLLKYFF